MLFYASCWVSGCVCVCVCNWWRKERWTNMNGSIHNPKYLNEKRRKKKQIKTVQHFGFRTKASNKTFFLLIFSCFVVLVICTELEKSIIDKSNCSISLFSRSFFSRLLFQPLYCVTAALKRNSFELHCRKLAEN